MKATLDTVKEKFREIAAGHRLGAEPIVVTIGTLTAQQAIGDPSRKDFPLLAGREVMIEARFGESRGQAFTDRPHEFTGSLDDVLNLELKTNDARAIFNAALNAVLADIGMVTGVRHCHDEEPERCAAEMAQYLLNNYGKVKLGLVGYQPAILENLVKTFGAENVRCTDLNPQNTGMRKYGAEVWDGRADTRRLVTWSDVLLVTGTTIVNDTYDRIKAEADIKGKKLIIFGVTGAGVSALLGLERLCFQPH